MIFWGIVIAVLAIIFFLAGLKDGEPFLIIMGSLGMIAGGLLFLAGVTHHSSQPQTTQVQVQTGQPADTVDASDNSSSDDSTDNATDNSSSDSTKGTGKFDPKNPTKWPGNDASKEERDKWWQSLGERNFDNALTVCRDGIQYRIFIMANGDYSDISEMSVWPRIHPDGKPFSCSENKDPTQEVSL